MKRLTTDDEKSMVFPLNTFYAKDGEVWVRGGGPYPDYQDVTLVQWIRSASLKHGLGFTADDPEHLGEEMYDALQDGDETVEGILALMHEAAVQAAEMRGRLKPIEDILGEDYDLNRLREVVEADQKKQCFIAKIKVGEEIYVESEGRVMKCRVQGISIPAHGQNLIYHLSGIWEAYLWSDREGIDFWRSAEDATSAIKGEKNGHKELHDVD